MVPMVPVVLQRQLPLSRPHHNDENISFRNVPSITATRLLLTRSASRSTKFKAQRDNGGLVALAKASCYLHPRRLLIKCCFSLTPSNG